MCACLVMKIVGGRVLVSFFNFGVIGIGFLVFILVIIIGLELMNFLNYNQSVSFSSLNQVLLFKSG